MSNPSTGPIEWTTRLARVCDSLVSPRVTDPDERVRQRRFVGVALAGPFMLAAAVAQVMIPAVGLPLAMATICLVFVGGWTACVAVAQTGSARRAGPVMLAAAIMPVAAIIQVAGGSASPLFLAFLPLFLEPYFVARSRSAMVAGAGAALAAITIAFALGMLKPGLAAERPDVGQWILPALYGATLWLRRSAFSGDEARAGVTQAAAVEDVMPAVVLRLTPAGEVLTVSPQARDIMRLEPEFLLGSGLFDRVQVADRVAYLSGIADIREGRLLRRLDIRVRLPAEADRAGASTFRRFAVELVGTPGEDRTIIAILRDIDATAAVHAGPDGEEADIARARFLAGVSHEMRTPLNAIIGFSDMLLHDLAGALGNDRQREYVGLVRDAGQHLLAVVNAVLDVAKMDAGAYALSPERFRFEDAVATCRAIAGYQATAKGVEIETSIAPDVGEVVADKRVIQQILINLLSNAVKFTHRGGTVTIDGRREGRRLVFSIADTGIGIAADDLARIGRPFVQVINDDTRQCEGTGLGLALVKGLVKLQNGTMTIESAPGAGTVVTIGIETRNDGTQDAEGRESARRTPGGKWKNDDGIRRTA